MADECWFPRNGWNFNSDEMVENDWVDDAHCIADGGNEWSANIAFYWMSSCLSECVIKSCHTSTATISQS